MTKKQRVGLVISAIWLTIIAAFAPGDFFVRAFLVWGLIPLLIGWGVWWIRRAKQ